EGRGGVQDGRQRLDQVAGSHHSVHRSSPEGVWRGSCRRRASFPGPQKRVMRALRAFHAYSPKPRGNHEEVVMKPEDRPPGAGSAATRYRFDGIVVDVAAHTVLRDGQAVALEPKAFAVLVALLRRPGELLGRDELLD